MPGLLEGTVALITGASSGIGWATAIALSQEGAAVATVARRAERLEQLTAEITGAGGQAISIVADIADRQQAIDAVAKTVSDLGALDIVVNNAGVMLLGPVLDAPTDEWDRMIELNQQGLLYVTHAALPHLLAAAEESPRRVADIVNISSVAGRRAGAGRGVYNMTKFGVVGFSEALRQEVTKRHVRVSVVEPGAVRTELLSHTREEVRTATTQATRDIEGLEAEDIANAILYIVTRPRRVAVNEILIRPTEQEI